uniref:Putative lectin/glucanase superfamily protein n=1 Tax=viral metagenome TaxID=1070528 RepID=A0A6H1ZC20_9ZZZZ
MKKISGLFLGLIASLFLITAGVAVDLGHGQPEYIKGNTIFVSDQQLLGSTFPNTTTLYVWNIDSDASEAQVDIVGSKSLAVAAGALTAGNDVLGVSKYCVWSGGNTYLQSTDTDFNVANTANTDDFMTGGWVYIPDYTPAARVALFSNSSDGAAHGYSVELSTAGVLSSNLWGATDAATSYSLAAIGYYHVIMAREVGVRQKLYVNGNLVATGADTTVGTTQSLFQLGGFNSATSSPEAGTRYDECFFKKGELPTNLDDVVREIYVRSAKKFAVKDGNDNVVIPANVSSGVYTPVAVSGSHVNVAAATLYASSWSRVGNVVTCCINVDIDPTAAVPTATAFAFTLPIACTSTPTLIGSASSNDYTQEGAVKAINATTAAIYYKAVNAGNAGWGGIYQYVVN